MVVVEIMAKSGFQPNYSSLGLDFKGMTEGNKLTLALITDSVPAIGSLPWVETWRVLSQAEADVKLPGVA